MGSNQSNTAHDVQSITTNIFEESQEVCVGKCTAIQSGNTIIISGSDVGNVDLTNQCPASASCAMTQQLNSQVSAIMAALAEQENTSSSFWPISFKFDNQNNSVTIRQSITNTITQMMQSICQSTSTNIQENEVVVLTNSEAGNVTLSNQGSANSTCTMNNLARQVAFNQQTAKTNQTNRITSAFTLILIIIVIVIIIAAIIALLIIGPVGIKSLIGSTEEGDKKNGNGDESSLTQLLSSGQGAGGEAAGGEAAAGAGSEASLADLALLA